MKINLEVPIRCYGRREDGRKALQDQVDAILKIRLTDRNPNLDTSVSLDVDCPYNTGGHGQRCKASHPDADKVGEGIGCVYSMDIPYASDLRREYQAKILDLEKQLAESQP